MCCCPSPCLQWSQGLCWAMSRARQYGGGRGLTQTAVSARSWHTDRQSICGLSSFSGATLPKKTPTLTFWQVNMPLVLDVTSLILRKQDSADDSGWGAVRRRAVKIHPWLFKHICMGLSRVAPGRPAVPAVTGAPRAALAGAPYAGPFKVSVHLSMTQDLPAQGWGPSLSRNCQSQESTRGRCDGK